MTNNNWDESKHPRDEEGKFTFKGQGTISPNDGNEPFVLKGGVEYTDIPDDFYSKTDKIKNENKYRNYLLDVLGDLASRADVLYATISELEDKIKENGLINAVIQKGSEFLIGKNYDNTIHTIANIIVGDDTSGMLDLAHGIDMNNRNYIKDVIHIDNYKDVKVNQDKEYLKGKLTDQFAEYGFNIDKIKGYFFKSNSGPCQRLIQNEDFKKIIRENKSNILANKQFSAEFKRFGISRKSNFYYAFGSVDFRNSYIDSNGNLHIKTYDTYDFNKDNHTPLNQAGRSVMKKGELKPFFTIHDIIIPADILQKDIWKD
ncbi:hypothetical protein II906_08690 [bacterium]|nr:hypothetical protein [bacterium]